MKIKYAHSLGVTIVELITNMILLIIVTRSYSMEIAGMWFLMITISTLASNLREGLIYVPMVRLLNGRDVNKSNVLRTSLQITLFFEIIISMILMFGIHFFYQEGITVFQLYPLYSFSLTIFRWVLIHLKSQSLFKQAFQTSSIYLVLLASVGLAIQWFGLPVNALIIMIFDEYGIVFISVGRSGHDKSDPWPFR